MPRWHDGCTDARWPVSHPSRHLLEIRGASVGAGFIYPICGTVSTMPGLAKAPAASRIDFDDDGEIIGLS